MNKRMIVYMLGLLLILEGLLLLLPSVVDLIYQEGVFKEYIITSIGLTAIGGLLCLVRSKNRTIFSKEGLVTVALGWVLFSLGGAIPFIATGEIPSFVDAFFETVSGFTTTGASILTNVEALTHASLFWRSFTHWMGGMGVLVFVVALVKMASGGGNIYLLRSESPGPEVSKLVPTAKGTAKILYIIYVVMTAVEVVALLFCKMPLFDALTTAFGTAGTGGFGIKADSIAGYTVEAQVVIAIFMVAFGVNFSCYYLLLMRRFKDFFKNEELRVYFGIILTSSVIITANIFRTYNHILTAFKDAFFNVASVITTTGFATADFDKWPEISRAILVVVMCIGATAGSTGGGLKIVRLLILAKSGLREIKLAAKPNRVTTIRYNGKTVSEDMVRNVSAYFALYMIVFILSFLLISFDKNDMISNITAAISTINNIGPGLGVVGPTGSFASYSTFSKLVFSANMLLGRLEFLPLFVLFSPKTWKR